MSEATEQFPAAPQGGGPACFAAVSPVSTRGTPPLPRGGPPALAQTPGRTRPLPAWAGSLPGAERPVAGVSRWVQGTVANWLDPARRLRRRRRRARRSLVLRLLLTAALSWLALTVGSRQGLELSEAFFGSVAVGGALLSVRSGRRLWRLQHTPLPPPRPGPLPPRASAARPPMERLRDRERVLADLLVHLGPAALDARQAAAEAAGALRLHAARAASVDQARLGAPAAARPGLDAALDVLLRQLDDGLAGYDALVAVVADAVCAAATFQAADPLLARRLQDATDALAGLAAGLREVSAG